MWAIGATLDSPLWILLCAITVNGAIAGSSGAALMALAANSYPLAVRSTGVGAAYAFGGRFGAFVAPMFGGIMLQMHWSPSAMCYIAGTPLLLGSLILLWLQRQHHFRHGPEVPIEAAPIPQPSA
jgi:MFS family permease